MEVTTFTVVVTEDINSPVTWRAVSTEDGTVVEDLTYTIPPEQVPGFAGAFLTLGVAVFDRGVETDNLATERAELAVVEASFPTGAELDAEDELRSRLTAEGIAHGNF